MIKTEKDLAMTIRAARMACPTAAMGVRDWYRRRKTPADVLENNYAGRNEFVVLHRAADAASLHVAMPMLHTAITLMDLWAEAAAQLRVR